MQVVPWANIARLKRGALLAALISHAVDSNTAGSVHEFGGQPHVTCQDACCPRRAHTRGQSSTGVRVGEKIKRVLTGNLWDTSDG